MSDNQIEELIGGEELPLRVARKAIRAEDLNSGQKAAVDAMLEFVNSEHKMFRLEGPAGSGKSTCIQIFVQLLSKYLGRPATVCLTAPTNKATRVLRTLRNAIGGDTECRTTYSLLGLKLKGDSPVRAVGPDGENRFGKFDVVVVDEGGMVSRKGLKRWGEGEDDVEEVPGLMDFLQESSMTNRTKVIFLCDRAQWNPVNQDISPVFDVEPSTTLTKVERHDNQILALCNKLREATTTGEIPPIVSDHDENGGVYVVNDKAFRRKMLEAFTSESYQDDPESFKTIAWTNSACSSYNEYLRYKIFGDDEAEKFPFMEGERVIACQPVMPLESDEDDDETSFYMATDDEGEVVSVELVSHPIYKTIQCWELKIEPDFGSTVTAYALAEKGAREYKRLSDSLIAAARNRTGSWQSFWDLKERIHDIRPGYAVTSHRAQGSTFEVVFVDLGNILSNRDRMEALRGAYVACSRARRILVIRR